MAMRHRRLLLVLLSTCSSLVLVTLLAMLLGWRFGPMREIGRHQHFFCDVIGVIVDAESGEPVADAWVSDSPMALPSSDTDGRQFIGRLIRRSASGEDEIPAAHGAFAVRTGKDGSFQLEGFGFWDYEERAYGIRLGEAPRPTPFDVVRTVIVEARGYERRAFSIEHRPWTQETPDSGGLAFVIDVARLEIRRKGQ